jgi:hypothetical protein
MTPILRNKSAMHDGDAVMRAVVVKVAAQGLAARSSR